LFFSLPQPNYGTSPETIIVPWECYFWGFGWFILSFVGIAFQIIFMKDQEYAKSSVLADDFETYQQNLSEVNNDSFL